MYVNEPLHGKSKKKKFRWWKLPLIAVALVLIVAVSYVAYVFISYSRIDDNVAVQPQGTAKSSAVRLDTEYTAMTYNVGFGAYTPDYTFFMDGGESSWAVSEDSVVECIDGAAGIIKEHNVDFAMIQEVDYNSTRSYHVDERDQIIAQFPEYSSTFAINYHSPFLFYPVTQPHGSSNSGLLTLSDAAIDSALRRSLPVSTGVKKILDLDRCYVINRIPVENGRELVIFNTHLSAYGTDSEVQERQLTMLLGDMKAEYDKGNYVICGGDYNHDFTGDSKYKLNADRQDGLDALIWAAEFPEELIPEGFTRVVDFESGITVPTTRNDDIPYGKDSFVVIIDGFIVSDNVEPSYVDIVDTGFLYSDHNPVEMRFSLK